MHLAMTLWLNCRLPSGGPKSDRLFCKLSLLFACLCRSRASRAPSSCVCASLLPRCFRSLGEPCLEASPVSACRLAATALVTGGPFASRAVIAHLESFALNILLVATRRYRSLRALSIAFSLRTHGGAELDESLLRGNGLNESIAATGVVHCTLRVVDSRLRQPQHCR